jgi:alpha-tubulin suppressor-like RCC1 family protein
MKKLKNQYKEINCGLICISGMQPNQTPFGLSSNGRIQQNLLKINDLSSVSAGSEHFAFIDKTGMLYMGGDNSRGQWGIGTTSQHQKNSTAFSNKSPFQKKVLSVSCGEYFTGAVTEDGKVYFWGTGLKDVFQDGIDTYLSPREYTGLGGKAIKIDCGPKELSENIDSCSIFAAILENLSVFLWINPEEKISRRKMPIISTILPIKARGISVDNNNLAIVSTDDKLYYLGESMKPDIDKLIGIDIIRDEVRINPIHIPLPELIDQVSLSRTNIGTKSISGNVYLWGSNYYGEVGVGFNEEYLYSDDGISESYVRDPKKFYLPGDEKFKERFSKVLSQRETTSVITQDGKLYMWGNNDYYKFIDRSTLVENKLVDEYGTIIIPNPIQLLISKGTPVRDMAVGKYRTIILTEDGLVNIIGDGVQS